MDDGEVVFPVDTIHQFIMKVMRKLGTIEDHANILAELLTAADMRGHYSHGLNRLGNVLFFVMYFTSRRKILYCTCTYFSGIHILVELALNQVRLFMNTLICSSTMNCNKESSRCANS